MNSLLTFLNKNEWILFVLVLMLCFPALLINLGMLPLVNDEGIRALVAFEMILSDNYVTPTINGEYYYNKPPLWNWILVLIYKIAGNYEEVLIRYPVVASLIFYTLTIYWFVKKHFGKRNAAITAFVFITNGCIWFDNSNMGLIDIFFSWLTYISFMSIYHFYRKGRLYTLFIITYIITAAGLLMKGLPSLAFQAISLLVFFIYQKDFRKLFSLAHIVGILIFGIILSAYFLLYSQYNNFETYFPVLWKQSSQKTFLEYGFLSFLNQLIMFPMEVLFAIIPWSLLFFYTLRKSFWKIVMSHPFLKFNFFIFIANIAVYWVSPAFMQRYLFMLYPLMFTIIVYFYDQFHKKDVRLTKFIDSFFLILIILSAVGVLALLFAEPFRNYSMVVLKVTLLFISLSFSAFLFYKLKDSRIIVFILVLVIARIGFNWFEVPEMTIKSKRADYKIYGTDIGKMTKGDEIFLVAGTQLNSEITYYIARERMEILRKEHGDLNKDVFYIIDILMIKTLDKQGISYKTYYDFDTRERHMDLKLIKLI